MFLIVLTVVVTIYHIINTHTHTYIYIGAEHFEEKQNNLSNNLFLTNHILVWGCYIINARTHIITQGEN